MTQEFFAGGAEDLPTTEQLRLLGNLVEEELNGTEFSVSWGLYHTGENIEFHITRLTPCIYADGRVQKRETHEPTPVTATKIITHIADKTLIEINFPTVDSASLGSQVNILLTDDGIVNAHLGTSNTFADFFGTISAKLRASRTDNEPMVSKTVGQAIRRLVEYASSLQWEDGRCVADVTSLPELCYDVAKQLAHEDAGERYSVEEAHKLAGRAILLCSTHGEVTGSVDRIFQTKEHKVEISRAPFSTLPSPIGENVLTRLSVSDKNTPLRSPYWDQTMPSLYFMTDGRILFSTAFSWGGPDFKPRNGHSAPYDELNNVQFHAASASEIAAFLKILQEPKVS